MKQIKIIVEKHPDGYVAYPLGLRGAGIALVTLMGLYVGAYYAMVEPSDFRPLAVFPRYVQAPLNPHAMTWQELKSSHRRKRFFAPIHWLDRRIRPHVWEPYPLKSLADFRGQDFQKASRPVDVPVARVIQGVRPHKRDAYATD